MPEGDKAPKQKLCVRCGVDCSDRARVKDRAGRYMCKQCADGGEALAESQRDNSEVDLSALAQLESAGAGRPVEIEEGGPKKCRNCGKGMPVDAVLCTNCGCDQRTGKLLQTQGKDVVLPKGATRCPVCKYDIKGLKTQRCPECGVVFRPATATEHARESSRETVRDAYRRPIILGAVSTLATCVLLGAAGHAAEIVPTLVKLAVFVPLGIGAYFLLCLLITGFDAPLHLTALRLFSVFATVELANAAVGLVFGRGFGFVAWIAILVLYVGLLMSELDLELSEAWYFALIMFVLKLVVVFVILAAFG